MGFVFLVVIGSAAGYLVSRALGVRLSVAETVVLGVLGTVLGSWIVRALLSFLGFFSWLLGAFVGVLILLWAYERYGRSRR
ncbi:MAG: GlsB/YeaQ/YmgE family stress response membrane protein [Pseudomonadota bacterium]